MSRYNISKYLPNTKNPPAPTWEIHYVVPNNANTRKLQCIDAHTHGLTEYCDSEFQIVLPMDMNSAGIILNDIGDAVRRGLKLKSGDIVDELIVDFPVKIYATVDCFGEDILRIIFPDENGRFPEDVNCDAWFAWQHLPTKDLFEENDETLKTFS